MVGSVIGFGGGLLACWLVGRRAAARRTARDPRAVVRSIEQQTVRAMLEAEWEVTAQQLLWGAGCHE